MKRVLLVTLAVVVTLAAVGYGAYAWYYAVTYVSTDDAYVEGTISPVSAKVSGHVVELLVEDNEAVKKGDLLLRVDPRDHQAKVAQARASVSMAESRVRAATERVHVTRAMAKGQRAQAEASAISAESTRRSALEMIESNRAVVAARRAAVGAARAELDRARAVNDRTRGELERFAKLVGQGLVAQRDYDQALADAKTAEAAVRAAQERITQAERDLAAAEADMRLRDAGFEPQGIGLGMARARAADARARQIQAEATQQEVRVRDAERELAGAELKEAQANLAFAELQLAYTEVRAATDGVVAKRGVELGQVVQVGQPLMAIVPLHDVWMVANFKETQLARLTPGMRADVTVDTFGDTVFKGVIDSISAGTGARFSLLPPENATGNWVKVVQRVPVKIRLETHPSANPHTLRAGMSGVVTIRVR
ncbi:MAG: HlyD family secretion protein [Candidatus Rokubacteria bacterium]|nr:HlyD family secretion protein [Candidatus Rokubacteria bacterium]